MSEFKGTPGPWDFSWQIQPNGCPTVGHKGLMVCMVAHSAKIEDQKEVALANASLISSAPDLLSLAKRWLALDGQWHPDRYESEKADLLDETRALIAKATD
jgi:hypothetical protein